MIFNSRQKVTVFSGNKIIIEQDEERRQDNGGLLRCQSENKKNDAESIGEKRKFFSRGSKKQKHRSQH